MQTCGVVHAPPSSVVKMEMSLVSQGCRWVLLGSGYRRREAGVQEPAWHGCVQECCVTHSSWWSCVCGSADAVCCLFLDLAALSSSVDI